MSVLEFDQKRLAVRARRLAERAEVVSTGVLSPVVLFRVNGERFGLPAGTVAGVTPLGQLTKVPGAAAELLGVMARRGELITVLSVSRPLGLPADGTDDLNGYVILLKLREARVGLLVTQVDAVANVSLDGATAARSLLPLPNGERFTLISDIELTLAPYLNGDAV